MWANPHVINFRALVNQLVITIELQLYLTWDQIIPPSSKEIISSKTYLIIFGPIIALAVIASAKDEEQGLTEKLSSLRVERC